MSEKKQSSKIKTTEDDNFKLPKLTPQKKSNLRFEEDEMFNYNNQSPFSDKKVVKISIDRLVPLTFEDVRKRIESKLMEH